MRKISVSFGLVSLCAAVCVFTPNASRAVGTNLLSTNVVGGGSSWLGNFWKTNNGAGVPVGNVTGPPVVGNTYTLIQGGNPAIGNNLGETRTRNPVTVGQARVVVFGGDSLTLNTNTEIRFKLTNAATPVYPTICIFPG